MKNDIYKEHPCELCGGMEFVEIPEARQYLDGGPVHVCTDCGFIQVLNRRSTQRIAEVWSDDIFEKKYTARIPAVTARLTFVAKTIDAELGVQGKEVCDIGAGEGEFLGILKADGATVLGIEPSKKNCSLMEAVDIPAFCGTIEEYIDSFGCSRKFDIVTITWTLENCESCSRMLDHAWSILKDNGHIVVATGSRILVPFKKTLALYMPPGQADTHAFRFSGATLRGLLANAGFSFKFANRYLDHDVLLTIGQRTDRSSALPWKGDDYRQVLAFFRRWHEESQYYVSGGG